MAVRPLSLNQPREEGKEATESRVGWATRVPDRVGTNPTGRKPPGKRAGLEWAAAHETVAGHNDSKWPGALQRWPQVARGVSNIGDGERIMDTPFFQGCHERQEERKEPERRWMSMGTDVHNRERKKNGQREHMDQRKKKNKRKVGWSEKKGGETGAHQSLD
ncbi:hypothetical protein CRG98_035108 [Punica granatum]|uniref:Uncharacterized protein n=1 Tax=Punica granatum TaxID=22663 RepID=A0A2I0IKI7_PUNGR|nr:hypothetical protein CRG98_035108 [Punica granatum]